MGRSCQERSSEENMKKQLKKALRGLSLQGIPSFREHPDWRNSQANGKNNKTDSHTSDQQMDSMIH